MNAGHFIVRSEIILLNPVQGHGVLNIPCFSFLIESKNLGKKVLYDLGLMKAWKEKESPVGESSQYEK